MRILTITIDMDVEKVGTIEDLILAQAQLRTMDIGFQELQLETPEWITAKLSEVGHEINMRIKGELLRRLRQAKARRSALRTADEKRGDLDREIAELEARVV
jgi:hypothetical protein